MSQPEPRAAGPSVSRLIVLILFFVAGICGLAIAPTLLWLLPEPVRDRPVTSSSLAIALLYAAVRFTAGRFPMLRFPRVARTLAHSETFASVIVRHAMVPALLTAALVYFVVWLPHFLLTPWSRDSDTFAVLALSWNTGVVPYRDIAGYNFPGHIYLFWLIGKFLGWEQTWGLYLVDALLLLPFAAALVVWSRRLFHTAIPGSVSLLLVLMYYTRLDFQVQAQRDWHATLAMASSILAAEAWHTRNGRVASALLAAIGFTIRPHVIAFLPAIFLSLHRPATFGNSPERSRRSCWAHDVLNWLFCWSLFATLGFLPLLLAGALPGFIGGLNRYVFSGSYGRVDRALIAGTLSDAAASPQTRILLPLLFIIALVARGQYRWSALTWLLAVIGVVIYRFPHPIQHNYLSFPLFITRMLAVAPVAGWLCQAPRIPSVSKLAGLCALGASSLIFTARLPELKPALAAIASIVAGEVIPEAPPPGALSWYHEGFPQWYSWKDYRSTLLYLRDHTNANTVVANVLRSPPFPAINGPLGRRSPFRAESGICWIWFIHEDRDPEFARELENGNCDVVVWIPGEERREPRMSLPRLCAAIRESFEHEAQFGRIEIWRRKKRGT
jgi:hypothetical protein